MDVRGCQKGKHAIPFPSEGWGPAGEAKMREVRPFFQRLNDLNFAPHTVVQASRAVSARMVQRHEDDRRLFGIFGNGMKGIYQHRGRSICSATLPS
jgi:hypothetical protein